MIWECKIPSAKTIFMDFAFVTGQVLNSYRLGDCDNEGTEQLRNTIRDRKMERDGGKDFLHFTPIFAILCIQKTQEVQYYG